MKFFRRSRVESISKIWLLAIHNYFCLKWTPEYSRPNIKHWKMVECDDAGPTVFDKTAYIKYHFSCTVKSSTKNTWETKSTRQTRKITFESLFWLPKKCPFCCLVIMLPISSAKWSVECALWVLNCRFYTEIDQHKPGEKCIW